MTKVFIHGANLSPFGKYKGTHLNLSFDTAKKSVSEFGKEKIEFLIYASFSPDSYTKEYHLPSKLGEALGLKNPLVFRIETASSSGASAFQLGANLIQSGRFKHGLVVATEIMSQLNREESNLLLGSVLSDSHRALNMSMAQGGAMITRRYLELYGYPDKDLYFISKKLHDNGIKNPISQIKKNLSIEEYSKQPMISSPLGLYDISPLSDGSACAILSTDRSDVSIRGMGHGTGSFQSGGDPSFEASITAYARAYEEANIGPSEIGIAELHDAFTTFELIGAEDAGLFPRGEALRRIKSGLTHPEGDLPINASGGLKSRGHPVGASGLAQIVELCRWFKRKSKIKFGLAHSIGGLATNNFAMILMNEP